jgi:Mn2+/Fe2+ NRAMP family transporter
MAMRPENFYRIAKMRKMLDYVVYASAVFDFAIAAVTLISINVKGANLSSIQLLLNYGLSIIVVLTVVIFAAMMVLRHYDRIMEKFTKVGFDIKYGKRRRRLQREKQGGF